MREVLTVLETIRRPRLLMQAALAGLGAYRRRRDLVRLIGAEATPVQAIDRLIAAEGMIEQTRLSGCSQYSPARHIELLAALIAEARSLPRLVG
jgi:Family of unknown function (DUF6477)